MNPLILTLILSYLAPHSGIIQQQTSKDGISVIYKDGKDTFALDYLTNKEYDSLCTTLSRQHKCRWDLCPYKGITAEQSSESVAKYVGGACTDAYIIDMLHIKYPTLDADQLDSLLIARVKTFSKFTITH